MKRCATLWFALAAFAPLQPALWAESKVEVDVVVDMTPEGRNLAHPDAGHPAFYFPVVAGYREEGAVVAGEKKPPASRSVLHLIAGELARQGYLVMNPTPFMDKNGGVTFADGTVVRVPAHPKVGETIKVGEPDGIALTKAMMDAAEGPYSRQTKPPAKAPRGLVPLGQALATVDPVHGSVLRGPPSIILVFSWGYMNPIIENFGLPGDPIPETFMNQNEMLALVGGNTLGNLSPFLEREEILQGAREDRYFVILSAYDFAAYSRMRKKVPLWQAKMSVPSRRVYLDEVLAPLVRAGGPWFGRETTTPKMLMAPITPEGKVEIGTLKLEDYQDAPPPPPPAVKSERPVP